MRIAFKRGLFRAGHLLILCALMVFSLAARDFGRDVLVLTSTNSKSGNDVVVFRLNTGTTASLSLLNMLATGGAGGASGNAGSVQLKDDFGAVVNFGSNSITQLVRRTNSITIGQTFNLATGCTGPASVALTNFEMFTVGANCIESFSWPSGNPDGPAIKITDSSAGQIAVGETWAAVTLGSGSLLQLPLTLRGALTGAANPITLPANANNTPLGAAFWGNLLGFNPAHSPDSFALVNSTGTVFPVQGPQPPYPTNAPCWIVKGAGNIWYSGNSPGMAISIFFSDAQGGVFYKSVPLAGTPTDITVSPDGNWLAVIYSAADGSGAHIAVFSIDKYGDLSLAATSPAVGVTSFNGVAISE